MDPARPQLRHRDHAGRDGHARALHLIAGEHSQRHRVHRWRDQRGTRLRDAVSCPRDARGQRTYLLRRVGQPLINGQRFAARPPAVGCAPPAPQFLGESCSSGGADAGRVGWASLIEGLEPSLRAPWRTDTPARPYLGGRRFGCFPRVRAPAMLSRAGRPEPVLADDGAARHHRRPPGRELAHAVAVLPRQRGNNVHLHPGRQS